MHVISLATPTFSGLTDSSGGCAAVSVLTGSSGDSFMGKLSKDPRLSQGLQMHGGRMIDGFGQVVLALGIGSVVQWMWKAQASKTDCRSTAEDPCTVSPWQRQYFLQFS